MIQEAMTTPIDHKLPPSQPAKNNLQIPSKEILPSYKDYRKLKQIEYTEGGNLILNKNNLKLLCMKEGLYEYPELNSKLYLHFKVIQKIQNLEEYVNLKTLYIQNNVIRNIQNIDCLPLLENLFIQNNMLTKIQNLQKCKQLRVINLSSNNIQKIQGLSQLQHLQNINLSSNQLTNFESVNHLGQCSSTLTAIELSNNRINYDSRFYDIMPQVKCLYLSENPFTRQAQHYRRQTIGKLKNLLYLDQRGVSEEERILGQRWVSQGREGFNKARQQISELKRKKKEEQKKEIMKDIDTHRQRKIILFKRSIGELNEQITKLREYLKQPENEDNFSYYQTSILQKQQKIKEFESFISSITNRMQKKQQKTPQSLPKSQHSLPQQSYVKSQLKTQANPEGIEEDIEQDIKRQQIHYDDLQTEESIPYQQSQYIQFSQQSSDPTIHLNSLSSLSEQQSQAYEQTVNLENSVNSHMSFNINSNQNSGSQNNVKSETNPSSGMKKKSEVLHISNLDELD